MASAEIEAGRSKNPDQECSIIDVGYKLTMSEEDIPDVGESVIFRVPKSLRKYDRSYSPHLVSIGPFHHGEKELKGMEMSKSEAVRRMQMRIQRNYPDASIKSFVENDLLLKDKEIRKFYGEKIRFSPIQLAWIVVRDACFIFEFLSNFLSRSSLAAKFHENEVKSFSWMYDAVFDVTYQNPMRDGLMSDILLFENQIPLWVLKDILQIQMGSPQAAEKQLQDFLYFVLRCVNRQNVFTLILPCDYTACSHVLEALYLTMLGENINRYKIREALQMPLSRNRLQKGVDSMIVVLGRWCKRCLPFPSSNTDTGNAQQTSSSRQHNNCMQIFVKSAVDSARTISGRWFKKTSSSKSASNAVNLKYVKLRTISELRRAGVKIQAVPQSVSQASNCSAIRWIRFDEKTSTLYLPQISVTPESYAVMSNFTAMEVSTRKRYAPNPMTQYVLFMDELIDSEEDVALCRKKEVIHNFYGSNQQVADFFNSLGTGIVVDEGCRVIDEARTELYNYMKRDYKILWNEFISAYFSKPWLVAGSIAATLLLLMTMSQVLCLLVDCNP